MNSTMQKMASGDDNFLFWINSVKKYIGNETEFHDACDIYSFATAYECGQTVKQAVKDYTDWINNT
jgi:hypothetical protein